MGSCNLALPETAPPQALAADPSPPVADPPPQPAGAIALSGECEQGGWARGRAPAGTVSLALDGKAIPVARDGAFFIAFDRDAGASASLVATLDDGHTVRRDIAIAPRAWEIERLDIPMKPGKMPSEEFLRIRKGELAQINAARALRTDADGWREKFIWPVEGRISGKFGAQRIYQGVAGSYHSGIDIATGTSGTPIVAPADGVVILAAQDPFTLEGHLLMIDHGMGLNSAFLHCSELEVKVGEHVRQGQFIARIGMTGRATGPHLHWSVKWDAARLDPLLLAGPMP
ncbi:MAG: M23 family metallopeptidase [Sphingomonadales bacterium]|nr:M23 family metallopeptidase [Sphingomonadales bacterium]MDE2567896.1 M23 family metallopeptidase [Sphingomonadales bacterium]